MQLRLVGKFLAGSGSACPCFSRSSSLCRFLSFAGMGRAWACIGDERPASSTYSLESQEGKVLDGKIQGTEEDGGPFRLHGYDMRPRTSSMPMFWEVASKAARHRDGVMAIAFCSSFHMAMQKHIYLSVARGRKTLIDMLSASSLACWTGTKTNCASRACTPSQRTLACRQPL